MPNKKSAKKTIRQDARRRLRNRSQRSTLRNVLKRCRTLAEGDDHEATEAVFCLASKKLDQVAAKNLIHKNQAARTKSRLAHLVAKSKSANT